MWLDEQNLKIVPACIAELAKVRDAAEKIKAKISVGQSPVSTEISLAVDARDAFFKRYGLDAKSHLLDKSNSLRSHLRDNLPTWWPVVSEQDRRFNRQCERNSQKRCHEDCCCCQLRL